MILETALALLKRFPDPETAHNVAHWGFIRAQDSDRFLRWLSEASRSQVPYYKKLPVHVFGKKFPGSVILPGGFDKKGDMGPSIQAMGFSGYVAGTMTPKAQLGNPRPRIHRDGEGNIINAMGFNNPGVHVVARNLAHVRHKISIPIIGSVGANKENASAVELVIADLLYCLEVILPHCDMTEINVTSPNTPGLRDNLVIHLLRQILIAYMKRNLELTPRGREPKPVILKVSPDISDDDLLPISDVASEHGISGFAIGNTSLSVPIIWKGGKPPKGGRSGNVLYERNRHLTRLAHEYNKNMPLISMGGLNSAQRALTAKKDGATLIGCYSGLIEKGPRIVHEMERACALAA